MNYASTRGRAPLASFSEAVAAGLAPDGGLYVPMLLPRLHAGEFDARRSLPDIAERLLAPFLEGDRLAPQLPAICAESLDIPAPLVAFGERRDHLLELFHGPTAAFKDFGARFLAACLRRLVAAHDRPLTILVATSGDTGAAVAAAMHHSPGLRVAVLYPNGGVSPRQAAQLACFGGNVTTFAVDGTFDDCQALVKQALADVGLQRAVPLSSANSISLGRLLPQMAYYASSALELFRERGEALNFVVPTGNLGNAMAGALARECGLPIGQIALAGNANRTLPDFFAGLDYRARPRIGTLANAMDVGAPSNFERLAWLVPDPDRLRAQFDCLSVDDAQITTAIGQMNRDFGIVVCPHTAAAVHLMQVLRHRGASGPWAALATAHPAKFEGVVEPVIGAALPLPEALRRMLARPTQVEDLPSDYAAFRDRLLNSRSAPRV